MVFSQKEDLFGGIYEKNLHVRVFFDVESREGFRACHISGPNG